MTGRSHSFRARIGRSRLPFRSVNTRNGPNYLSGFQRHHIIPRQVLKQRAVRRMLQHLPVMGFDFDDFRCNGILLPSTEEGSVRSGLPMHRGPHQHYNQMVLERVGTIEEYWSRHKLIEPHKVLRDTADRVDWLVVALRRKLISPPERKAILNRNCPIGLGRDYSDLDFMAEQLWGATSPEE